MAKKEAKKRSHTSSNHTTHQTHRIRESNVNPILIENFVSLQKVLTNLSVKLDNVSTQISKLLDLFEISAKALAEKDFEIGGDSKDVVERLDKLLDQNKILAKGISLMHERMPREHFPVPQPQPMPQMQMQPKQQMMPQQQASPYIRELPAPPRPAESIMKPQGQRMAFSQEMPNLEEEESEPRFESPL